MFLKKNSHNILLGLALMCPYAIKRIKSHEEVKFYIDDLHKEGGMTSITRNNRFFYDSVITTWSSEPKKVVYRTPNLVTLVKLNGSSRYME